MNTADVYFINQQAKQKVSRLDFDIRNLEYRIADLNRRKEVSDNDMYKSNIEREIKAIEAEIARKKREQQRVKQMIIKGF